MEGLEIKSPFYQTNKQKTTNTVEGNSSRLEMEDKILELKDKIKIEEKTRNLSLTIKCCEKNMQKLSDSLKNQNLRIMVIEEGEEVQAKGMCNISNKIITENFPNLEKDLPMGYLPMAYYQ
jgi:hypothetical protein